jgi:O-antigen/teichoic acid export membrane protein
MRLIINIASSYFRFLASIVVVVMLTPYILEQIGIDRFGLWSLCLASAGVLALLDMGLSTATVKYVAERTGNGDHRARNEALSSLMVVYSALGIICATTVFLVAEQVVSLLDLADQDASDYVFAMQIIGLCLAFALPLTLFKTMLVGAGRFDMVNVAEIIGVVLNAVLIILMLELGLDIYGLAIAYASILVAVPLMLAPIAFRILPELTIKPALLRWERLRELLPMAFYFLLANIAMLLILRSDVLIIKSFLPLTAVAAFAIAARIGEYAYLLNKQFSNAIMPLISQSNGSGDRHTVRASLVDATRILAGIATMLIGLGIFHAETLVVIWVGEDLLDAALPLRIILLAVLFSTLHMNASNVLGMSGGHRGVAGIMLASAAVHVLLSLMLIPEFGIIGAALAMLISAVLVEFGLLLPLACKQQGVRLGEVFTDLVPCFIAAIPMLLVADILGHLMPASSLLILLVQSAVAASVFIIIFITIGLTRMERKFIHDFAMRVKSRSQSLPLTEETTHA